MNTRSATPFDQDTPASTEPRHYRPKLLFYHANAKGSGSAAQFECYAASGDQEGRIFVSMAPQRHVAEDGQNATFDWKNKVVVKLGFSDLSALLLVLNGRIAELGDGKGLYHDSKSSTTIIRLAKQADPYSGYAFELSRKPKEGNETISRVRIVFSDAEAYGLACALEQSMGLIAFGDCMACR